MSTNEIPISERAAAHLAKLYARRARADDELRGAIEALANQLGVPLEGWDFNPKSMSFVELARGGIVKPSVRSVSHEIDDSITAGRSSS